ncbi:hypothetical protein HJC23_000034 [Cyclotella cryptica]|uniref:Uncharacterized protein n=1 Tax=Cyclotella cryptica TaxID=29204 RepID=A0ABD3P0P9_9STRA|eukprot:CCRYP_018409-RA/>CCRYP_018409-RA protein AED:0.28 eAED:0.28 QI:0/-1/0/1/-1/1/1/0/115
MGQKQSSQPAIDGTNNASASQSESTPTSTNVDIAAMIKSLANPPQEDSRSNDFGQPIHPQSDAGAASKFITDCRVQQRASLQCIEENYENKDAAQPTFLRIIKNVGGRSMRESWN